MFFVQVIRHDIQYLLGNGAKSTVAADDFKFLHSRGVMCWARVIRKIRNHRKMGSAKKCKAVEHDIIILQLSFSDESFEKDAWLLLAEWRSDSDLHYFLNNFEWT